MTMGRNDLVSEKVTRTRRKLVNATHEGPQPTAIGAFAAADADAMITHDYDMLLLCPLPSFFFFHARVRPETQKDVARTTAGVGRW